MFEFIFTGTLPCGCTVAAMVDDPKHKAETDGRIGEWLRVDGYSVRRAEKPVGGFPLIDRCIHKEKK